MAVINVRGTSGSGKSTLVRKIMERYPNKMKVKNPDPKRKRPLGYIMTGPSGRLAIIGHYESPCGGCDTIKTMDEVIERVKLGFSTCDHVLFEGAIVSTLWKPIVHLHEIGVPVEVISLDTPLELCFESINERRMKAYEAKLAQGKFDATKPGPVDPKATTGKWRSTRSTHLKLRDAGIPCTWASRENAELIICERFEL